jgi:hypothetical protein
LCAVAAIGLASAILPAAAAPSATSVTAGAVASSPATRDRIQSFTIGHSVRGRPIVAHRSGTPGGRVVLVVGNTHGDEPKGVEVTRRLRIDPVPDGIDLWTLDTINPDGMVADTRTNANGVDLNRNFSVNWGYIPPSTTNQQYSGEAPADQPETQAIENLIRLLHPAITVWYHQDANRVSVGGHRREIPVEYARLVGQVIADTPCTQGCTGTGTQFANRTVAEGTAFLVELPGSDAVTDAVIVRHAAALLAVAQI